jgi:O-antigen/teichoic acid export membrane protein
MSSMPDRLRSLPRVLRTDGAKRLMRKGAWGFADHAQISASGFIMTVLLARVLSPTDFGLYALAYTALITINQVQGALVNQPFTMLGAPKSGEDFGRYTTATLWTQVALSLIMAATTALISGIAFVIGSGAAWMILACAPATAAWQMQEYIRRVLYVRSHAAGVFFNDVIGYSGQFAIIVLLWWTDRLTTVSALMTLTLTSFAGVLLGIWQIRSYLGQNPTWRGFLEISRSHWDFGKWLMGGNLAAWTSGKMYPVLAAGFISVAVTGAMKAVQTILGPMNTLTFALDPLLGPRAARANAKAGIPALRTQVGRMQIFVLGTVGVYCLLVSIFAAPILEVVYSDQYTQYAWLLVIMAINYAFAAFRGPFTLALTVLNKTDAIFRVRVIASVANLTIGILAVILFGVAGIGAGLLMNGLVLLLVTWHYYLLFTDRNSRMGFWHRARASAVEST